MGSTHTITAGQLAHAASARPSARAEQAAFAASHATAGTWAPDQVIGRPAPRWLDDVAVVAVSPAAKPSAKPYGVMPVNFRTTAIPRPLEASP
jgi:hypothetical protein